MVAIARKMLLLVTVGVLLTVGGLIQYSENVDSATELYADDVSISSFSESSEDYDELVYLGAMLPFGYDPAEWIKDQSGIWHNVNEHSAEYGSVLTYGAIGNVPRSVVDADLQVYYGDSFTNGSMKVIQIRYSVFAPCSINVGISKSAEQTFTKVVSEKCTVTSSNGTVFYFENGDYQSVQLVTVACSSSTDYKVGVLEGVYNVDVAIGADYYTESLKLEGHNVVLSGKILDYNGVSIPNTIFQYTVDGVRYSSATDGSGAYSLIVRSGSVVSLNSLDIMGMDLGYSFGTVSADIEKDITTAKYLAEITVTDADDHPVPGAILRVAICKNLGSKYVVEKILSSRYTTDDRGRVQIPMDPASIPSSGKVYVYLDSANYHYERDVSPVRNGVELPEYLIKDGNLYLGISSNLSVLDNSVMVHVVDSASLHGIPDVEIDAYWVTETRADGIYSVQQIGASWNGATGSDGVAYVPCYNPDPSSILCIQVGSATMQTDYGRCSFHLIDIFEKSETGLVSRSSNAEAVVAIAGNSIPDEVTLRANESICKINCEVLGDGLEQAYVDYLDQTIIKSGSVLEFSICSFSGTIVQFSVSADGYKMDISRWSSPTLSGDVDVTINAIKDALPTVGSVLSSNSVHVDGATVGEVVSVEYTGGSKSCKVNLLVGSDSFDYSPQVAVGSEPEIISVSCDGRFVHNLSGGVFELIDLVEKQLLFYKQDTDANVVMSSVRPNLSIEVFVYGTIFTTVNSASGITSIVVPDIAPNNIEYRWEGINLEGSELIDGSFAGCLGFNVIDIVDVDLSTYVTLNFKYLATAESENSHTFALYPAESASVRVGDSKTYVAPSVAGYDFVGWYLNEEYVSDSSKTKSVTLSIDSSIDGSTLCARYSQVKDVDVLPITVGLISVVIALVAFGYVILQSKKP